MRTKPSFDANASQVAEVVVLLQTLVEQNEMIFEQLLKLPIAIAAASQRRSVPSSKDREALLCLLPAVYSATGDGDFLARDLINDAKEDVDLREALEHALGPVHANNARRLGRLLKRGMGVAEAGLRVIRLGEMNKGALWKIERE